MIFTKIGKLLLFIGMAIDPALAGIYLHSFYISVEEIAVLS
jgi:hypothetical protein